jgi:hypothetical protein
VHHPDAGIMFKKLGGHMRRRADTAGAKVDLSRIGFSHADDVGDRMCGECGVGH